RQVRRIGPLEDTVDIAGGAPEHINVVGPIGYETAAGDVVAKGVHGRQSVPRGGRGDQRAGNSRLSARRPDQTALRVTRERVTPRLDSAGITRVERAPLHFQQWCHRLDRRELVGPGALDWVADDPGPGQAGRDFLEQLEQLSGAAKFESGEAGGVAAGLR